MATGNLGELQFAVSKSIYNQVLTDADWIIIKDAMDAAYDGNAWSEPVTDQGLNFTREYIEKLLVLAGQRAQLVTWTDDD